MGSSTASFGSLFLTALKAELKKTREPISIGYALLESIKAMEREELLGFLHGRFFLTPALLERLRATETPAQLARAFAGKEMSARRDWVRLQITQRWMHFTPWS